MNIDDGCCGPGMCVANRERSKYEAEKKRADALRDALERIVNSDHANSCARSYARHALDDDALNMGSADGGGK